MRDITALAIAMYEAYKNDPIPYWYGAQGEKPTAELAEKLKKRWPNHWTTDRLNDPKRRTPITLALKATFCCDCIGWIRVLCLYDAKVNPVGWPRGNNGYSINGRNWYSQAAMDISANQTRNLYGGQPIRTLPEPTESRAVFVSMDSHIGLYVGNGYVIEQTPPRLQRTKLANRNWTSWGYIPTRWRDFMEKTVGLGTSMDCSVKGGPHNVYTTEVTPSSPADVADPTPKPTTPKYRTHTVIKGDTPWSVAQKLSKNGENWSKLVWLTKSDGGKKGTYKSLSTPIPYKKGTDIFVNEVLGYPV